MCDNRYHWYIEILVIKLINNIPKDFTIDPILCPMKERASYRSKSSVCTYYRAHKNKMEINRPLSTASLRLFLRYSIPLLDWSLSYNCSANLDLATARSSIYKRRNRMFFHWISCRSDTLSYYKLRLCFYE